MTLQEVEKSLEAAWASLVAEVHSMFHKAPVEAVSPDKGQDTSPASPVVEVAPAQAVEAPVVKVAEDNRFVGYFAKYGDDLYGVEHGENIELKFPPEDVALAKAAGFTKVDEFIAQNVQKPLGPADPSYDPSKTVLDVATDHGHLFVPPVGTTVYTMTSPAMVSFVIDGTQTLGEFATCTIEGGKSYIVGFGVPDAVAGGELGRVDAGKTFTVTHNIVVGKPGVEINP